jgi:Iap family predicted aminopeptidase
VRAAALVAAVVAVLWALAGCDGGEREERDGSAAGNSGASNAGPAPAEAAPEAPAETAADVGRAGLEEHLRALQAVADRHGGNRAAGTGGDRASVEYVETRLRQAGWRVRRQPFRFSYFRRGPARVEVAGRPLRSGRSFRVLSYSGSGRTAGRARPVGLGCRRTDFEDLRAGEIPVARRGVCFFRAKAAAAERAGAPALLVVNEDAGDSVPEATLGDPGIDIPVVMLSGAQEPRARARIELDVETDSERRTTTNVIAETPGGEDERMVMAGAHLDSVAAGPGLNDNASGVATLLELAEGVGPRPPGAPVRLAFWGAEELGLLGSRHYVRGLDREARDEIGAYLNFDMVGSPNAVRSVYSDGDPALERLLRDTLGRPVAGATTGSGSDHAVFDRVGIPVGGLYTGAAERGPGGEPRDPCYHRACDTIANVDRAVLTEMARAATEAVERLSRRAG